MSSLQQWVDEQRKAEAANKKKAEAAASKWSRIEKDDVVTPSKPPTAPLQDERKEAVQAKRADAQSLAEKPKAPAPTPAKSFLPSFTPVAAPAPLQGPPAPAVQGPQRTGNASNGIDAAATSWRTKPSNSAALEALTQFKPVAYVPPKLEGPESPQTGVAAFSGLDVASPTIKPAEQPFLPVLPGVGPSHKPAVPTAPGGWNIDLLRTGEGQQGAGGLGAVAGSAWDKLKSWLPATEPGQAGPHGTYGQDGQAQKAADFLWPDTGATSNPAWDWWKKRQEERAAQYNAGLGDKQWVNPFAHVSDAWNGPEANTGRFDADQAAAAQDLAERQQNAAMAFDPLAAPNAGPSDKERDYSYQPDAAPEDGLITGPLGALGHNLNRNIAATPGIGPLWRGAGYKAQDAGELLSLASRNVMATRIPQIGPDGQLNNDLTVAEGAAAFVDSLDTAKGPATYPWDSLTGPRSHEANLQLFKPSAWSAFGNILKANVQAAVASATPSAAQLKNNAPADVANAQAVVKILLPYSLPEQRQAAMDEMLNKDQNIQQAQQTAAQAIAIRDNPDVPYAVRQKAAVAAADAGRQIADYTAQTNLGIADKYTNVLRDGVYTTLLDPVGWGFGKLLEAVELAPAARRLASAAGGVFNEEKDAQIAVQLGKMTLGPDVAKMANAVPELSNWAKAEMLLVRPGETKAAIDAQTLYGGIVNILKDADTKEDWRLILQTLGRQPEQLVKGLPVNLFSSQKLQDLAVDGVVKWPAAVFGQKGFLAALQGPYRAVADDLPLLDALTGSGLVNKLEGQDSAAMVLLDAFDVGGLRRYGRATEYGQAPLNTVAKLQDVGGGQAVITWLDNGQNVVKTSEKMPLGAAKTLLGKLETEGADKTGALKQWGDSWRSLMSKMWLNTRPATTITNALGGNLQMFVDGDHSFKPLAEIVSDTKRFFGGAIPNKRLAEAANAAPMAGADWLNLQKVRSGVGELARGAVGVGEQNLAAKAWYGAFSRGFNRLWNKASDVGMLKAFETAGIEDQSLRQALTNTVKELGSTGDKAGMVRQVQEIVAGKTRPFNLSDINPIFREALTPDGLTELNQIMKTADPAALDATRGKITDLLEREATRWQNYLLTDPGSPKRYAWSATEVTQDGADILRDAEQAIKKGADPVATKAAAQQLIDAQKQAEQHLQTLTQLAAEAQDPSNRYMLYNVWADIYSSKTQVRQKLADLADDVYAAGGGTAWQAFDFFKQTAAEWLGHNQRTEQILADAHKAMAGGAAFTPRFDAWSMVERQASRSLEELTAVMQAEPRSGLWDTRLKKSIEAGRAIEDKAAARTFAAARRFNVPDALDHITAAERDSHLFGAQATAAIREKFNTVVRPFLGTSKEGAAYEKFYDMRNQIARELRSVQYERWDSATRAIVADGVGQGLAGGLQVDLGGIMGKVTIVGPGQGEHAGQWAVVTDTGATHYLPAAGEAPKVAIKDGLVSEGFAGASPAAAQLPAANPDAGYTLPKEAIARYKNLAKESEETIAMEMDNINSAHPFAEEAQQLVEKPYNAADVIQAQGGKTATELANEKRAALKDLEGLKPPTIHGPTPPQTGEQGIIGVWRHEGEDTPIKILGKAKKRDGLDYYNVVGHPEPLPANQLYMLNKENKLYKITDVGQIRQAREVAERAAGDIDGLKQARASMRDEWNRIAKGEKDYLKLDSAAMLYGREGIVRVPDLKFEDLYGNTIAGYRIESQADVEKFIEDYVGLQSKIRDAEKGGKQGKSTYKALLENYEPAPQAEEIRATVRKWSETKEENIVNFGNLKNDPAPDLHTVVTDLGEKVGGAGNYGHLMISDAAKRQLEVLRNLERQLHERLPQLLSGQLGQLAPNQQLSFIQSFMNEVVPYYDKAVQAAAQYGDKMQSFTMVDMTNNTHLDNLVALGVPYHHWYTRSVKNALERMIFQPGLTSKMANEARLVDLENQQANVAPRDEGTIPFTIGDTTYRMRTGADKYIPYFPTFIQNNYANPEEASNALTFATETAKVGNFGIYPWLDAAAKIAGGKGDQINIPGLMGPYATLAQDAAQYLGVPLPKGLQRPNNDYLIGREAFRMAADGVSVGGAVVTDYEAKMVQEYERMQLSGQAPLPEMLPLMDRIKAIQTAASKRVGGEKLLNNATGFLTNAPLYTNQTSEQAAYEKQGQYYARMYGPDNPDGSKLAADAESPYASAYSTRKNVTDLDTQRPGVSAVNDAYSAEYKQLQTDMHAAAEAYIRSHPNPSKDEVDAVTQPYQDKIDALKTKYPSMDIESTGNVPKGMNPNERAQWQTNKIVRGPVPAMAKPEYPKDGTPAQLTQYYADKLKWDALKNQQVAGDINQVYGDQGDPPSDWQNAFKAMNRGKFADDLIRETYLQNASDVERAWTKQKALEKAQDGQKFAQSAADIERLLGKNAAAEWQAYLDLPAGDARKQYAATHPNIAKAKIAGYNPSEYQAAQKLFGQDAWDVLAARPDYPSGPNGAEPSEAQKQAYYAQMDAYSKAHPNAEAIKLWVNGRAKWSDFASTSTGDSYNDFGKDYAAAIKTFGPNIFKTLAGVPKYVDTKAGKAAYFDYMRAHPEIYAYNAWKAEFKDAPESMAQLPKLNLKAIPAPGAGVNASMQPDDSLLHQGQTPLGQPPGQAPGMAGAQTMPLAMPKTTPGVDPNLVTWGNPNKTMMQYAEGSEAYQKAQAGTAAYNAKHAKYLESQAAYQARRQGVASEFGDDAAAAWDAYGKLPKGSQARADYRAAHPELKAYDMAAYNPEQYAEAKKLFGDTAWLDWAQAPAGGDTDEGKAARAAYMDAHPMAKLMQAWVYGRPSGASEQEPGEKGFSYNFGQDFAEAQKLFGDDIWSIFGGYKSDFSKEQKKAFFEQYPQLDDFFGWWYGNDKSGGYAGAKGYSAGYRGAGGYSFGGYGGGGGGGGGGGDSPVKVDARYMDRNLQVTDQDLRNNAAHAWRPHNIDLSWLRAGEAIGPENLKKWKR